MARVTRLRSLRHFNNSLQDLVRALPPGALLPLALAIFSLFALLGPVTSVLDGGRHPNAVVIRNSLFAGIVALGYAFGSMRRNWVVLIGTLVVQLLWVAATRRVAAGPVDLVPPERIQARLTFDGVAIIVLMVASYSCFLWFINGTAARYLRVRAEMDLAHEVHKVLVPVVAVTVGGVEFSGVSNPSGEVGGDLVDVVQTGTDGARTWFGYVADVSGHGVSSGVVMGMFKSALRMRLLQGGALSAILDDLNRVLFPLKSGSMFVTLACVRGGATGDTLEYAVAGHLPILRVRAGTRLVEEITTPQIPIAMFEDYRFSSGAIECGRGDLLALVTDGLTEVFDAEDRELGLDRVKQILAASAERPLPEISAEIVAAARAHGAQIDDQTLLLIRRS